MQESIVLNSEYPCLCLADTRTIVQAILCNFSIATYSCRKIWAVMLVIWRVVLQIWFVFLRKNFGLWSLFSYVCFHVELPNSDWCTALHLLVVDCNDEGYVEETWTDVVIMPFNLLVQATQLLYRQRNYDWFAVFSFCLKQCNRLVNKNAKDGVPILSWKFSNSHPSFTTNLLKTLCGCPRYKCLVKFYSDFENDTWGQSTKGQRLQWAGLWVAQAESVSCQESM